MKQNKKVLALLLAAAMICSMLTACGSSTENPESTQASTPTESTEESSTAPSEETTEASAGEGELDEVQVLNTLHTAEPGAIDPARFGNMATRSMLHYVTEMLTRIENGSAVPAGAESWEVSDDGLTYTFHLRDNKWSDGKEVTSQDYLYALQRQADPENAFELATDYFTIKNFQAVFEGTMDMSELGVTAPDDKTLVIELEAVTPTFVNTDLFPCREDLVTEYGDQYGTEAQYTPSCGPFSLSAWTHNSVLTLSKNENHWNAANMKMETVNLYLIPDANAQLASFENGTLDYLAVTDADYINKFQSRDDMGEISIPQARTSMIIFNCEDKVFANSKIRLAFSLALNRDILAEVLTGGTATPAYGLCPPATSVGTLSYREHAPEPLLDLQQKYTDPKALLLEGMKEANLGDDVSKLSVDLSIAGTTAADRMIVELYQQMLQEALGCTVTVSCKEKTVHSDDLSSGNFQMGIMSWGGDPEPNFQMTRWTGDTVNYSHWHNEEYNNLVNQALQTVDENERLNLYYEAEKLMMEEAPIAPTYFSGSLTFYYNYVNGFVLNPFDTTGYSTFYTSGRK